jgi:hypothetical protein
LFFQASFCFFDQLRDVFLLFWICDVFISCCKLIFLFLKHPAVIIEFLLASLVESMHMFVVVPDRFHLVQQDFARDIMIFTNLFDTVFINVRDFQHFVHKQSFHPRLV